MRSGISVLIVLLLPVRVSAVLATPLRAGTRRPGTSKPVGPKVTIVADFEVHEDYPLVKDKVGVYQTPFMAVDGRPSLTSMKDFLALAGVRDLRYEIAWGKPDTFAFDQVQGTPDAPVVDFTQLDPFLQMLRDSGVQPLLAATYNPLPFQACSPADASSCWRTPPSSYKGWKALLAAISSHYAGALGIGGVQFEMWNEPDLVLHGSKVFFDGGPQAYGEIYKAGAAGVRSGAANLAGVVDARTGGPAIAYDISYLTESGLLREPHDFLTIHAYGDYSQQIAHLQHAASAAHDTSPLYLTEYGSFPVSGAVNPSYSGHAAAMRFFTDVNLMLRDSDVAKIYWAQWIDDNLGMITYRLHPEAIFNAYRIYQTMVPVDRVRTVIGGNKTASREFGAMAAGDPHTAGIVIWNTSSQARAVNVHLTHLPFASGTWRQWYVDENHASFGDGAPQDLTPGGDSSSVILDHEVSWTGTIRAQSLVYLHASDGQPDLLASNRIGTYMGDYLFFPFHPSAAYADFDPHTSIARLGMGRADLGTAVAANVYDVDRRNTLLRVDITKSGPLSRHSVNSIFGIRIEFQNSAGTYSNAVLYADKLYNLRRTRTYAWGTKRPADVVKRFPGKSFDIDLAADAPPDWNGHRIIIAPLLEDAGATSRACLHFTVIHS